MSAQHPDSHGRPPSHPTVGGFAKEVGALLLLAAILIGPAVATAAQGGSKRAADLLDPTSGQSGAAIQKFRADQAKKLGEHGVVNAEAGLYSQPIADAMARLVANPGLLAPLAIVQQPGEQSAAGAAGAQFAKGMELFGAKGCGACHSIDGKPGVGPTLKGLMGRTETMADGSTVQVDEAYVTESILKPMAKVVQGFPPAMPPFEGQLADEELKELLGYLGSIK